MLPRNLKVDRPPTLYLFLLTLSYAYNAYITMSTPYISPPLPLPIGFKLLPSLLPGNNLTPCLYTEIVRSTLQPS
jgi:hypothetical protein